MTNYLFFDTETTGKYDFKSSPDAPHQPHLVQLAMQLVSSDGKILATHSTMIRGELWKEIEAGAQAIHGISAELANAVGAHPAWGLQLFDKLASQADYLVAHNYQFDSSMIRRTHLALIQQPDSRIRVEDTISFMGSRKFCTMTYPAVMQHCGLPGFKGQFKWPKLSELHWKLFNREFSGAHDALVDVIALRDCFFELKRLGIITI